MRTALDAPVTVLDAHEQTFIAKVREHGWFHTHVFPDEEAGFSYTTGFWINTGFPELIVFSLPQETADAVLWDVYRDLKGGRYWSVGVRIPDLFANCDAYLLPVGKQNYRNHLGWSRWFYGGDEFPCLQLVWPDRNGAFPWELGSKANGQPDISPEGWIKALGQ